MPVGNVIGDFEPSYSPNGGEIAFVRAPASYSTLDIWIMDRDGNGARRMTAGRWAYVHGLAWTPQRNELVFTAGDLYSRRSYAVNAGGGTAYPLSGLGENDRFAHVQAGRTVYARYINPPLRIWRLPRDDAGAQAQYFGIEGAKLAFSPDGERVAYMRGSGDGHAQIWTARSDGSDQQALVDVRSDAFNPYWSADGSQLLFNSLDSGNWDAYLLDIESGRVRQITKHPADDYYPRFSRDQQWIYISSNRSGRYEVYRMAAAGDDAAPVRITRGGGIDGVESHDGEYVYYESTRNADPSLSGNASIWRVATHGDDNGTEVLNGWGLRIERSWALAESGIYFLVNGPDFVIRHLNLATKQLSDVYRGSGRALYPAVPPDEKSLFVSIESPETSELWLVDDYAP
jgi:Tol biopolymer transport system component